jgi:site-specific recombinase XerD
MRKEITLQEAVKAYLKYLRDSEKSPRTLYTYGKDFEQIQRFFGEERQLSSILKPHVGKFLKSEELLMLSNGKYRAEKTVKKTYGVLRQFLGWAQAEGYIGEIPIPKSGFNFKSGTTE